jgi:chromosome segregation ATPase
LAKRTGLAIQSAAAKLDELLKHADASIQRGAAYRDIHDATTRRIEELEGDVEDARADGKAAVNAAIAEHRAAVDKLKDVHALELKAATAATALAIRDKVDAERQAAKREDDLKGKIASAKEKIGALQVKVANFERKLNKVRLNVDLDEKPIQVVASGDEDDD